MHAPRLAGRTALGASAVLVLLPYATLALPFRSALYLQAAAILAVVLLAGGVGLVLAGWRPLLQVPQPAAAGLALYALSAIVGALVGLLAGNSAELVAGQLLSMALLPLGAAAGLLLDPARSWFAYAAGVGAAAGVAALLHLAEWGLAAARGRPELRLMLPNSVSLGGLALLALLLALAGSRDHRPRLRAVAWLLLALLTVYLVGTGTRGLWLVALPSVGAFFLLAATSRPRRRAVVPLLASAALVSGLAWGFHRWLERERPNLLPFAPEVEAAPTPRASPAPQGARPAAAASPSVTWEAGRQLRRLLEPVPLPGPGVYRLRVRVRGGTAGAAFVSVRWLDGWGERLGALAVSARPFERTRWLEAVGAAPEGTAGADLVVFSRPEAVGVWTLTGVRLERLGSSVPTALVAQAAYLDRRLRSLAALAAHPDSPTDVSVADRLAETRVVLADFRAAPWRRRILGYGLGATFHPAGATPPAAARGHGEEQNYLHNFYAFLLFKLGLAGTLAVASALALWLAGTLGWTRRAPAGRRRHFLAAAAAAWLGYLALGVSSPEILNFRLAPLLGLLLAASLGAAGVSEREAAPPGRATPGEGPTDRP